MSARCAEALPESRLIALSSAVILPVSEWAALSAARHPGSAAGDLAATTIRPTEAAPTSTARTIPTIDKTRPAPARAFDLTRPTIEKIRPKGQIKIASTIPATAKPLRRLTGGPGGYPPSAPKNGSGWPQGGCPYGGCCGGWP